MKKVYKTDAPLQTSGVTRGKYANLLKYGSNIAILAPDVVEHFPDSESVNSALRAFLSFRKEYELIFPPKQKARSRVRSAQSEAAFDPRKGIHKPKAVAAKAS